MTEVYNRTYQISDKLGVKQHVDFSYMDRLTAVVTVVVPRPRAGNPPVHRLVSWESKGVEVNASDTYVTGISRTYEGIREGATCTVNGKQHTILWIDNEQSVTYNILARPERNR
jgi:hypothetical protein